MTFEVETTILNSPFARPAELRFVDDRVFVVPPNDRLDLFLSPYYGLAIERLRDTIVRDPKATHEAVDAFLGELSPR
jgi:hypothetical protein